MGTWYDKYRNKIKSAGTDKELDGIIDEIFEEGFQYGKETLSQEYSREPIYNEGYD